MVSIHRLVLHRPRHHYRLLNGQCLGGVKAAGPVDNRVDGIGLASPFRTTRGAVLERAAATENVSHRDREDEVKPAEDRQKAGVRTRVKGDEYERDPTSIKARLPGSLRPDPGSASVRPALPYPCDMP